MPKYLFHTTSLLGMMDILRNGSVTADPYAAFSEVPLAGDISKDEVTLMLKASHLTPHLDRVEYEEYWYDQNQSKASYIAGSAWKRDYRIPDSCFETRDDDDPNYTLKEEERIASAYRIAELEAFYYRSGDRQWVSQREDDSVRIPREALVRVITSDSRVEDAITGALSTVGISVPVGIRDPGCECPHKSDHAAGVMFSDGHRILLLNRSFGMDAPGTWTIPGGWAKDGEDPKKTAFRECGEEIGGVPDHEVLDWYVLQGEEDRNIPYEYVTFLAKVGRDTIDGFIPELDHESVSWGWFQEKDLEQLDLHPGLVILLEHADPFFMTYRDSGAVGSEPQD